MGIKFKPLNERVANEDAFSDGTHEKVAQSLCSLISGGDNSVTIGLEGKWGAGKTTVLQLLKNKINREDEGVFFFSFDAWAHEGDPLRRIFLEMLLDNISSESQGDELERLRKEVSGKHKTIEVTRSREVSRLGVALAISAMLIPIGASMLSIIDTSHVSLPSTETAKDIHWPFTVSLVLLGMPLLTLATWCIATIGKKRRWAFMQSVTTDDYIQDVTGEPDKTSIEFERYFKAILAEKVGSNKPFKKVVIVLDNIDRLSKEHIRNVWATMQSFFQHRNSFEGGEDELAKSIWFIVPYDREILSEALDGMRSSAGNYPYAYSNLDSIGSAPKQEMAPSLTVLEKSIQVTAEVPEPAMTGWSEYLDLCIDDALGSWSSKTRCIVKATCHACLASLTHSPTPRRLRSLVNQVGFNGLRWIDELGADSIVIYSLLRLDISAGEMRTKLLSHDALPINSYADPARIRKEIAAMLFGLSVDRALQMLLGEEINLAIKSSVRPEGKGTLTGMNLSDLQGVFGDGFWLAWKAEWPDISPTDRHDHEWLIAITVNIQNHLGVFLHKIESEVAIIRNAWSRSRHEWDVSQYDYSEAFSVLINWFPEDSGFFESISFSLNKIVNSQIGNKELGSISGKPIGKLGNILPQICMMSAIVHKEKLRSAEGVPSFVVRFWASGSDADVAKLNSLRFSIDMVRVLSQLSGIEGYETADFALKLLRD